MLRSFTTLALLLVLIAVNVLSYTFFTRFDFTEGQMYTLSQATKTIVKNVKTPLEIKVFVSDKLPAQVMKTKQELQDYVNEYAAISRGKLKVTYTDPAGDPKLQQLAQMLGIPELQLNVIEKDQQQVMKAYMGLAVIKPKKDAKKDDQNPLATYDRYEVLPFVQKLDSFEYDLTSAIKKVDAQSVKTVGFLTGHKEHTFAPDQNQQMFMRTQPDERADYGIRSTLEKNYTVTDVLLTEEHPKVEGVDTLVIAGPKEALKDYEVKAIGDFVASGKNAVFLIDQIDVGQGLQTSKLPYKFSNLLDLWGVSVAKALVKDESHDNASFSQGFFSFSLPYPYWVKVKNLNQNNAITSTIDSFVIPWASPLQVQKKDGVTVDVLASTSNHYALSEAEMLVDVPAAKSSEGDKTKPAVSATPAAPQKELKDQPINLNPQQDFGITQESKTALPLALIAQKKGEGKVFIMGDSDFVSNSFSEQFKQNTVLFMNVIDSFTLGDDLIAIRSKAVVDHSFGQVPEGLKNIIRWGNILLVPTLFIIYGLVRRAVRNAKKNSH